MGNAGSHGFQDGVVSRKELERMQRRCGASPEGVLLGRASYDNTCSYLLLPRAERQARAGSVQSGGCCGCDCEWCATSGHSGALVTSA